MSADYNVSNTDMANNVIATLGDTVFYVTTDGAALSVFTFDNFQRTTKARYATHDIHMRTQLLELIGFEAESVSISIRVDVFLGVSPEVQAAALRDKLYRGLVQTFIIGGIVIGDYIIEDVKEVKKHVNNQGKTTAADINLSLKEYII